MERLTRDKFLCMHDFCTETECELYEDCPALARYNRLKAYEDTGLSPEEVMALKEGCEECEIARRDWELSHEFPDLDHIRELVKTEKEGRLLVLPCPIGSTVYVIGHKYRDGWDECWVNRGKFRPSDLEKIGDRVFLTYEEARAKIFAMNRGNYRFRFIERSGGDVE